MFKAQLWSFVIKCYHETEGESARKHEFYLDIKKKKTDVSLGAQLFTFPSFHQLKYVAEHWEAEKSCTVGGGE